MAELSCGGSCMKYLLFIFNFIFWLAGAAILGLGIWLKVDPNVSKYLEVITFNSNNEFMNAAAIAFIVIGAVMFLVGFLGCCGACKESSCMLFLYAMFLVIIFLAEIAAVVLAFVFRRQLGDELRQSMTEQAQQINRTSEQPDALTATWTAMQVNLKCCGSNDYRDYRKNPAFDNNFPVPQSCCVWNNNDLENPDIKDRQKCFDAASTNSSSAEFIYQDGCYDNLGKWFENRIWIIVGIGIGIALLQILGMVFACCVRKEINETTKYN